MSYLHPLCSRWCPGCSDVVGQCWCRARADFGIDHSCVVRAGAEPFGVALSAGSVLLTSGSSKEVADMVPGVGRMVRPDRVPGAGAVPLG